MIAPDSTIRLFLAGDVMTGRGIDQILAVPSDPELFEPHVHDAHEYVRLAERANGPIPRDVQPSYIWGFALEELRRRVPDVRVVNLETAVTTSPEDWPGKGIHYRMHPRNVDCLTVAGIDCCLLANNHVLDWGYPGLEETLSVLELAGIRCAGAGRNMDEARRPAVWQIAEKGTLAVVALGSRTSGIPSAWTAAEARPGLNVVDELDVELNFEMVPISDSRLGNQRARFVVSIHWGPNWGYPISSEQRRFAQRLINAGADLVFGHSSHHVKGLEVYKFYCRRSLSLLGTQGW